MVVILLEEALMKVRASTLDDLLNEVFRRLIASGEEIDPSKGKAYERTGVVLELTNPRARISRTETRELFFSWLGELLWYLAGSDDFSFIKYYIKGYEPDGKGAKTVMAAYGPRLRSKRKDQLKWIISLIRKKPDTRRAVIPIFQLKDTHTGLAEVPCTCTLQFLLRSNRLQLIAHMRSNDAFKGLPGDIFAFTMIQELVARSLGVEVGVYKHLVGSLHLYASDTERAHRYLAEGFQERLMMPIMPLGDQLPNVNKLVLFERGTRLSRRPRVPADLPAYWQDLATLLSIFKADKNHASASALKRLRQQMHSDAYASYIEIRQKKAEKRETAPALSSELPFN